MLDINIIRKDKERVRAEVSKRGGQPGLVDSVIELDQEKRNLLQKVEELRAEQNKVSKEIPALEGSEKQQKLIEMKAVSNRLKELEPKLKEKEAELSASLYLIPNLSHPSVPVGPDESGNEVEKKWGEIREFDFEPKNHVDLATELDLLDLERGAKVSGSRFYYVKNQLVRLEFALIQYFMDFLEKKDFTPMMVPMLVRESAMEGTGFFPAEKNEIYSVNPDEDDLYLIGTSEVPIAGYHQNEIIDESDLPKKYVGFSTCFRREAGSHGKDTHGIFRVHQFDKVEMFQIVTEEQSWNAYDELVEIAEELLQRLELPYQKLNMCTGDISPQTAKKYDLEVWIPSQKKYRELVSATNTTTYQSRRLKIRYKDANGKKHFAHMHNSTAGGSMTRLFVAILENYQNKDGSITVPSVLRPYMGEKHTIQK